MITLDVNGRKVTAQPGETLLGVLQRHGFEIPTLCHLAHLAPSGACRMCVVEVDGDRALVASCAAPVRPEMKVLTHSPRVLRARRTLTELLLADHPDECLYCARSGECSLQQLSRELGVTSRRFEGDRRPRRVDVSSPSIRRDDAKCLLCGRCVRTCDEVQGVGAIDLIGRGSRTHVGTAFDGGLDRSGCVNCGQCVTACPTGALQEHSHLDLVLEALADPEMTVVVQHAPAVSVTLAELYQLPEEVEATGALTAALRRLGFHRVFDTSFSADLTILEEATELVHRLQGGGPLPMFTSCSPGWVRWVETQAPELIPHLSTCKSPQQMLGALVKGPFAERAGLDPDRIFSVSVMPCTAKKAECQRSEMLRDGLADVDAVLTTRELVRLLRMRGVDLRRLEPEPADDPFGERSSAGKLFGGTGGVMEAALRTAHRLVTGEELAHLEIEAVRGHEAVRRATVQVGAHELGVAVVSGLGHVRPLLDALRGGEAPLHFVEVMTCPGGCINGGGQPFGTDADRVRARLARLHAFDRSAPLRTSHGNPQVQRLYDEVLGRPCGEASHALLHTHYQADPADA